MFTIVIQAGGQSIRMGQDKALLPFMGVPLISRVVERLSSLADELLITTNQPEAYQFLGVPLVSDIVPGKGALGGLYTALHAAQHPITAVVACDMPFLQPQLLSVQNDLLIQSGADVVIPRSKSGLEPMHAVYRREACLPAVKAAIEANERRMISWFSQVKVREMAPDEIALHDPEFRSFINVNSPEEFQMAEELAQKLEL